MSPTRDGRPTIPLSNGGFSGEVGFQLAKPAQNFVVPRHHHPAGELEVLGHAVLRPADGQAHAAKVLAEESGIGVAPNVFPWHGALAEGPVSPCPAIAR